MKHKDVLSLGIPKDHMELARELIENARSSGMSRKKVRRQLSEVLASPSLYHDHLYFGELAQKIPSNTKDYVPRSSPAPWKLWGKNIEETALDQIKNACRLPVAIRGALMPDAHLGYGLPIGGVLATKNAVIPYAVGVDIACRVKMTVFDMPEESIEEDKKYLSKVLVSETRFGIGASFQKSHDHPVMSRDWSVSPITQKNKRKAESQLGTSGSGNHFVEFGVFSLDEPTLGLEAGRYLALLSHSGSRGTGSSVADHYSKLAMSMHPKLPPELKHLAWLDLDSEEGKEYWDAMELMGHYASANHDIIHREIIGVLGAKVLLQVENHHNFAWKEVHDGQEVIVHRKGATPAAQGDLGIIPGSMASPAYLVEGKGSEASLFSASHGAGRVMSRRKAKKTFDWKNVNKLLKEKKVTLLSAGLDEVPYVYKNIDEVMGYQSDLVDTLGRFDPRIVKMAPAGERPED